MPSARPGPAAFLACLAGGLLLALSAGGPLAAAGPAFDPWARGAWLLEGLGAGLLFAALGRPDRLRPVPHGLQRARWRRAWVGRAATLGAVFGLGWQLGTVWWIYIGLHTYAELPAWQAAAAVLALGLYLATYSAAAAALHTACLLERSRRPGGPLGAAVLFASTWLLAELGRGTVFTGFGWAASGHAHVEGPLRPWLPWLGAYGVGAASAFLAALAIGIARHAPPPSHRRRAARLAALALAVAGAAWAAARDFTVPRGEMEVLLLQGNFDQRTRFEPAQVAAATGWYRVALKAASADLVLAPETALPVLAQELAPGFWDGLRAGAVLIGMPQGGQPGAPEHNALVGRAGQAPYRYDKHHLVPFGEFTPPGFAWFTGLLRLPLRSFVSGPAEPPPLTLATHNGPPQRVAPTVCFEDLFGEELARRFRDPAQAPSVLANASNLAWFDDAPAMAQHLRIAQIRSLEFQRPTIRAANTGPTVIIDHRGRVVQALAPRTRGKLAGLAAGRDGLTPYAWWVSRAGQWPWLGLALAGLWLSAGGPWLRRPRLAWA